MFTRTVRQWSRRIVEAVRLKTRRNGMRARPSSFRPSLEALEVRAIPSINPIIGDVFYIELENHNFAQPNGNVGTLPTIQQIEGNSAAPYINSLITPGNPNAAMVSYATNYHNVLATPVGAPVGPSIHPSEPNYIWQEGGSNFGVIGNDLDPYAPNGLPSGNNVNLIASTGNNPASLSALLQAQYGTAGWHAYQEDMEYDGLSVPTVSASGINGAVNPYNGSTQFNFAVKHDGTLFFTATNGGTLTGPGPADSTNTEAPYYSPIAQLATDLAKNTVAKYNLITPDQFNDMHTKLAGGFTYNGVHYTGDAAQIAQGDNFLSKIIPMIEASAAFKNNGAIVIWNDETEPQDATDAANMTYNDFSHTSTEIVISPLAKGNAYASTLNYTHSSDLKTLQELFGVPAPGGGFLGDANTPGTNDLNDMFVPGLFTPSTLGGTVVKNSGTDNMVVPGLTIVLTGINNADQVVYLTTTTAADGSYAFTGLLPGTYSVTVQGAPKDIGISNINLGVGESLTDEDFSLLGPDSMQ
jgi:hypothetical protein